MKIGVWYHCKLAGAGIPSPDAALEICAEQMAALRESGLSAAAAEVHLGINGPEGDALVLGALAPSASAQVHPHGPEACTELSTLAVLRRWLTSHPGWAVFYHHSKGVTQPEDGFRHHHRRLMEKYLVFNWPQCVRDLERGYEAVGINWVDPITRPVLPGRYYAGNFWWARSDYLVRLPPLPDRAKAYNLWERVQAEGWIGSGHDRPLTLDYERPQLAAWCQDRIRAA